MPILLTDHEIQTLLAEPKPLPENYLRRLALRHKRGHHESELQVTGEGGSRFEIILRQSWFNPIDFSVILAYYPSNTNRLFRLRRYNGKAHQHTNKLEKQTVYGFHIHQATERYQDEGFREDTFAEVSDRFSTLEEALDCLLQDGNFKLVAGSQGLLFPGGV